VISLNFSISFFLFLPSLAILFYDIGSSIERFDMPRFVKINWEQYAQRQRFSVSNRRHLWKERVHPKLWKSFVVSKDGKRAVRV